MAFGPREDLPRRPDIWRAGPVMIVVLVALTLVVLLLVSFVGLELDGLALKAANLVLVGLPLGLWWAAYYRPSRRSRRVLPYMPLLILIAGLLANGVALPIIHEVFKIERWLVTAPGNMRILGYMLTVGFLQEYLKFATIRYSVFPGAIHERGDAVAYGVAVSVGFATVMSLHFFASGGPAPLVPALIRVASITLSQITFGAINGYFLAAARFAPRETPIWWFAFGLTVTALFNGLYTTLRGGVIVSGFGIGAAANAPVLGLLAAAALALITFLVLAFLSRQAEARDAASPGMVLYR